jgi:hypothetical protein
MSCARTALGPWHSSLSPGLLEWHFTAHVRIGEKQAAQEAHCGIGKAVLGQPAPNGLPYTWCKALGFAHDRVPSDFEPSVLGIAEELSRPWDLVLFAAGQAEASWRRRDGSPWADDWRR